MMGSVGQAGLSTLREEETLIRFDHVPSYSEFFDRCLLPNRPCILPPALISQWNVVKSQAWHRKHSSSRASSSSDKGDDLVNWEALAQDYGSHTSPVVVIHINAEGETIEERTEMTIASAIDLIWKHKLKQDKDGVQSIYIKDWHLIKQLRSQPTADEPYSVPNLFADDWMNNIHPSSTAGEVDDFRFVYAGTAGSQTLLHRDVYTSYSWSTNVVGRKKWHIFPPRAIPHLRRFPAVETSQLVSDIQTLQTLMKNSNGKDYPQLERAWELMQGIDQEEGETIFIPSNWYHEVSNVTEAISINRNWCNPINLPSLYEAIKRELEHVEESLCDVRNMLSDSSGGKDEDEWKREFYVLVQGVAVKDAGWAWKGFWDMVVRNLEHPATKQDLRPKDGWVKERLLSLVKDFELREDGKWLDGEGIQNTAQRCKGLLEDMR